MPRVVGLQLLASEALEGLLAHADEVNVPAFRWAEDVQVLVVVIDPLLVLVVLRQPMVVDGVTRDGADAHVATELWHATNIVHEAGDDKWGPHRTILVPDPRFHVRILGDDPVDRHDGLTSLLQAVAFLQGPVLNEVLDVQTRTSADRRHLGRDFVDWILWRWKRGRLSLFGIDCHLLSAVLLNLPTILCGKRFPLAGFVNGGT